jgi:poly(3-hydroxybutyrate) depolymerase
MLVAAPFLASADPARGQRLPSGDGSFVFSDWKGPALTVFTHLPPEVTASTPIVFVMHGKHRRAENYRKHWSALADENNFIVVTPLFDKKDFPSYSYGAIKGPDKVEQPEDEWAFAAIEPMFDALRKLTGSAVARYAIYGHSAGAQFVHRFVLLTPYPRISIAVAANAGSYAMPVFDVAYPFGLRGVPVDKDQLKRAFTTHLIVLLGTADTDPNHPDLPKQPAAIAQGPFRLARGEKFFSNAKEAARMLNAPFNWEIRYAEGVAHSDGRMAPFAAPYVMQGLTR